MAARKRPQSEEDRMTDANIIRVIQLLENPEEGKSAITKKEACSILGMAYNTTRLATIINTFKEKQARDAKKRAEKRGKPASTDEILYAISEYLNGEAIDTISKATYRSSTFIKNILEQNAVPIRSASQNYFRPELIPEGARRDRFTTGEVVYSARYGSLAQISGEQFKPEYGWIYRVWLLDERWKQYAYQEAYELASLQHLRDLGVRV